MRLQKELRKAKQTVREWVRGKFSDQQLASVAAFNADGKMNFRDPCCCLLGVTYSDRLHASQNCDQNHYRLARRHDLEQSGRFRAVSRASEMGKVEKAFIFLGYSADFRSCLGDDRLRQSRFSALLRAEMQRRITFVRLRTQADTCGLAVYVWHNRMYEEDVEP